MLKKFSRRLKNIREDKLKKLTNKIPKELKDKKAILFIKDLSHYFNQNIAKKSFKKLKHKLHNISTKKFLKIDVMAVFNLKRDLWDCVRSVLSLMININS